MTSSPLLESNPSTDLPSFPAPDPVVDSSVFPELPSNESSEDLPALPRFSCR